MRKANTLCILFAFFLFLCIKTTLSATPVEWFSFNGVMNEKNQVELSWVTASELNTYAFVIQRSDNGVDFYDLGHAKAAIYSTLNRHYYYTDTKELQNRFTYYRIKQIDWDSSFEYSNVVAIERKKVTISVDAFPNPTFGGRLKVQAFTNEKTDFSVSLHNIYNKPVYQYQQNDSQELLETIDVSHLAKGWYILHVQYDEQHTSQPILISQ